MGFRRTYDGYLSRCSSAPWKAPSAAGLLERNNRDNPWAVVTALFAAMFDDHTIGWLNRLGYLQWDQRGQGEAIIAAVNAVIGRQR